MKNKKLQKKLLAEHKRAVHERLGALLLVAATLIGATVGEHQSHRFLKETTLRPAYAFMANSGRENETARMPVKFDDGLRLPTVSGN